MKGSQVSVQIRSLGHHEKTQCQYHFCKGYMAQIRVEEPPPMFIFRCHTKELVEYQRKLIHKFCCYIHHKQYVHSGKK